LRLESDSPCSMMIVVLTMLLEADM
jgi:hypothetical protein